MPFFCPSFFFFIDTMRLYIIFRLPMSMPIHVSVPLSLPMPISINPCVSFFSVSLCLSLSMPITLLGTSASQTGHQCEFVFVCVSACLSFHQCQNFHQWSQYLSRTVRRSGPMTGGLSFDANELKCLSVSLSLEGLCFVCPKIKLVTPSKLILTIYLDICLFFCDSDNRSGSRWQPIS